ncbi:GtrA family protein [Nocardioides sp. AE5]|uniref:GtrA family protein n=1 Tax=Nocardioides sp. AE5 TaxID=2962573 RepID=UPI0028819770|nr:GtrA family protein [Nocardioides sp. AE5]MDT0201915.1 GtrA family protein [Nocardioides sp. AE5]
MGPRARRLIDETLRFLAVGGVATLVAFVIFNVLSHGFYVFDDPPLHGHPTLSYVIANSIGMVISYRGTKMWAFKHRETALADGGLTAYVAINLATMTLPIGCLWISRNILDLDSAYSDNIAANVVGLGLGTIARFYLFRQVIFSQKNYAPAALVGTSTLPLPGNQVITHRVRGEGDEAPAGEPRGEESASPEPDPRQP